MSYHKSTDNEIDFYGPLASEQNNLINNDNGLDNDNDGVGFNDYTEGASDREIENYGLDIAHRRRESQSSHNDNIGGSIFSGPDNASVPSSVVSFRHGLNSSSHSRRPSLDHRDSLGSVFSDSDDHRSRRLSRSRNRRSSQVSASSDRLRKHYYRNNSFSQSNDSSPLLSSPSSPVIESKQSGVFSGIAAMFGRQSIYQNQLNDDERPSFKRLTSNRSTRHPRSRSSSVQQLPHPHHHHNLSDQNDSDTDWGYSSNEEISGESSDMASSAAASLNDSETSSLNSDTRGRRSNEFIPTGTFASDPVFGDTRIPMEMSQESQLTNESNFEQGPQSRQKIYIQEEDVSLLIIGYRKSNLGNLIYALGVVLSFGILALLTRWIPSIWIKLAAIEAPFVHVDSGKQATFVIIETQYGHVNVYDIKHMSFPYPISSIFPHDNIRYTPLSSLKGKSTDRTIESGGSSCSGSANFVRYLDYRYTRFILHEEQGLFRMIRDWRDPRWISQSAVSGGLTDSKREERSLLFGPNEIEIEERGWGQLFVDEVLHPFYVFQVASIILWSIDDYYYYAFCIAVISISSILSTLVETKRTVKRMKEMSKHSCSVWLKKNNECKFYILHKKQSIKNKYRDNG